MPQSIAPPKRGWRRIVLIGALLGAAGVSLSVGEDLYVSNPVARILSDRTGFSDTVAEAKKGDKLTVVAREDKWVLVRYGEKQGYVLADSWRPRSPAAAWPTSLAEAEHPGCPRARRPADCCPAPIRWPRARTSRPKASSGWRPGASG